MSDESQAVEEADVAEDAEGLLSDDEKDALLAGMADGSVVGDAGQDARTVTPFVLRPDAYINYGSFPLLQAVASKTAKRLGQRWGRLVRNPVTVAAMDIYTATYAQAIERLRAPMLSFKVELAPLPAHCVVILDNALLAGLVNSFFGFSNEAPDGEQAESAPPPVIREQFTSGELRVAELAVDAWSAVQVEAWSKTYPVAAKALGNESDPAVGMGLEPKDPVIVSVSTVQLGAVSGNLYWLVPHAQIGPIADDLEGATNARPVAPDPDWYPCWRAHLANVDVRASATVGRMRLSLRRIINLAPGDLIALDDPERARLLVGATPCAEGKFGSLEGNNAFQLGRWTHHQN